MISVSTFVFALVLAAVACAALVSIISWRHMRALGSLRGTMVTSLVKLQRRVDEHDKTLSELRRAAPSSLAAEVADLANAVDKLRLTHRRFAGRFDQYVGQQRAPVSNGDVDDEELAAELALQSAPAAGPGVRS